jgi:P-type conjugative transfer protein TrbG
MNRPVSLVLLLALGACNAKPAPALMPLAPEALLIAARLLPDVMPEAPDPQPTAPVPAESLLLVPELTAPLTAPPLAPPAGPPLSHVAAANREAVREPRREGYVNAVQVYPWSEGALYRLYTAPERVSEIALEPGESLVSVAAGDTVRWVIGDTTSGAGDARRTHLLVKPTAAGLATNLVIATDRRVYHVQLESTPGAAMTSVSWSYPQHALMALERPVQGASPTAVSGISLETLTFGYVIEGDDPPWRPLRAFDDGHQVFIEFPASLAQGEAPPLFVSAEDGSVELVNYRVRGRFYVVDRLFAAAELRLGETPQKTVRIVRSGADRAGKGRRAR